MRAAFLVGCLLLASPAAAQDVQRVEAGAQIGAAQVTQPQPGLTIGPWVDVNVSKVLAVEARATALSFEGTSAVHVEAGVRATFVRSRHLSFYGLAMPGWYRIGLEFPAVIRSDDGRAIEVLNQFIPYASSHFVLDLGAGLQFQVGRHLLLRAEGMRDLHADGAAQRDIQHEPIASEWDAHVGASYAFGQTLAPPWPAEGHSRWIAGPQVGLTMSTDETVHGTVGGFVSYRLLPYFDLDAAVSTFVGGSGLVSTALEGGDMSQAVVGGKVGLRRGRTGVFFKVRAGLNSYSKAGVPGSEAGVRRSTMPALDLGGVIELTLAPKSILRFDIGESLSFTPSHLVFADLFEEPQPYRFKLYSLPMRVGLGWRF